MGEQSTVLLARLRIDGGTQPRVAISDATVNDYAELMNGDTAMPPVDVFFDGVEYWLADGFHRYHAAQRLGLEYIRADIRTGTKRDAVLFSVGVNQTHGLRRTNEDKRKAVATLVNDDEWGLWSNAEIARRCGCVSPHLVAELKAERDARTRRLTMQMPSEPAPAEPVRYKTKHGTEATMHVEKIGRTSRGEGKEAARVADLETRKAAAVEGASNSVLKRLPKKSDAVLVSNTVQALRGILGAFEQIDPAALSDHPQADEWRGVIAETIGVLRSFNKRLERRAV